MKISRISQLTGKSHEMDLPITMEQIVAWKQGQHIQEAMAHLTPDQREFLITGITPEEWETLFGPEGPEDEEPTAEDQLEALSHFHQDDVPTSKSIAHVPPRGWRQVDPEDADNIPW